MQPPFALIGLPGVFDAHSALSLMAGATVAGLTFIVFLQRLSNLRPFGASDSESVMNFSWMGTLSCICGKEHQESPMQDRRSFCRTCGFDLVKQDRAMLEKQLTSREIEDLTRSLDRAAVRASRVALPPTITTLEELQRYLDTKRTMPSQDMSLTSQSMEQPQIR